MIPHCWAGEVVGVTDEAVDVVGEAVGVIAGVVLLAAVVVLALVPQATRKNIRIASPVMKR
jgi:hypothetical protein